MEQEQIYDEVEIKQKYRNQIGKIEVIFNSYKLNLSY